MSTTFIILIATVIVSMAAFNNSELMGKLIFWPRYMNSPSEYYRFVSSGFVHADWNHLFFNMFALYCFGSNTENGIGITGIYFMLFYLSAIIVSDIPSFLKNRNNSGYRSLGASGGVAAIMFLTIYYYPWSRIRIMFIPIGIPAILFAALYLVYSFAMSKRGMDNVGHDVHIWGSVYGFVFAFLIDSSHGVNFIQQMMNPY